VHNSAWGQDKRTNTQQMSVVLTSGCREIQGSGGTTPSSTVPRGEPAQGSSRTGCRHQPAWLDAQYGLGTVGLRVAGQEGKAINISLLRLGGSQMQHSCHEGEMLSTLTVTSEDVNQQLHKANVKNSAVWVSCMSKLKKNISVFKNPDNQC